MTQTQDEQNVQGTVASTPDLSAIDLSTSSANTPTEEQTQNLLKD